MYKILGSIIYSQDDVDFEQEYTARVEGCGNTEPQLKFENIDDAVVAYLQLINDGYSIDMDEFSRWLYQYNQENEDARLVNVGAKTELVLAKIDNAGDYKILIFAEQTLQEIGFDSNDCITINLKEASKDEGDAVKAYCPIAGDFVMGEVKVELRVERPAQTIADACEDIEAYSSEGNDDEKLIALVREYMMESEYVTAFTDLSGLIIAFTSIASPEECYQIYCEENGEEEEEYYKEKFFDNINEYENGFILSI